MFSIIDDRQIVMPLLRCLKSFFALLCLMPVPAFASGGAGAPGSAGGHGIFLWFLSFNAVVIMAAALMKRRRQAAPEKATRHKQAVNSVTYTVRTDLIETCYLFDRTREFGEDYGLPVKVIFDLCLIVEETLTYVISNGFEEGQRASLQVRLALEGNQAHITVNFNGRELNPLEAPKIDTSMSVEDLPLEGWDIHLLRCLVDDLRFERSGQTNIFTVVKKWEAIDEVMKG